MTNITIIVNQRPFSVNGAKTTAIEIRSFVEAPDDYEVWKITGNPDPEGQLPVDDVQITDSVDVKSGDRFRVVPPGTFGNTTTIPHQLFNEIESLMEEGHKIGAIEEGGIVYVIFDEYLLPQGYNKKATRLLIKVPLSYPNGNPDMFWVDSDLQLTSGITQANSSQEVISGQAWLRFSWHIQRWTPATDNLRTFLEFINQRLGQLK